MAGNSHNKELKQALEKIKHEGKIELLSTLSEVIFQMSEQLDNMQLTLLQFKILVDSFADKENEKYLNNDKSSRGN